MCGKRVPQSMHRRQRINLRSFFGRCKNRLYAAITVCASVSTFKQPMYRAVTRHIGTEHLLGFSRQNRATVFFAFTVTYENAMFINLNIRQSQFGQFAKPQSGGVDYHQDTSMFEVVNCPEQSGDLGFGQHLRYFLRLFSLYQPFDFVRLIKHFAVENFYCAGNLILIRLRRLRRTKSKKLTATCIATAKYSPP